MTIKWTHRYEIKPGRWVFEPTAHARKVGLDIKASVSAKWAPPQFYYHLRNGGHVAALHKHVASKVFYRLDLEDFFGSVNRSRITRCLKRWFSYSDARAMASESVVRRPGLDGFVLPYGFVQSPILASLALDKSRLGAALRRLEAQPGVRVSVYVDDIVVSGDDVGILQAVETEIVAAAEAAAFPINASKIEGPSPTITVFNVELSHGSLQVGAERLAEFRAAYQAASSEYQKEGILGYIGSINKHQESAVARSL